MEEKKVEEMAHPMSTARLQFDVQLRNYLSSSPMKTPTNSAAACPPLPLFFQVLPLISLSLFVSKVLYQSIIFVRASSLEAIFIFVCPLSFEELEQRLRAR
jgi:hypothetical protein